MTVSWQVFLGTTVFLMGGFSFMTGHALAATWRPWWQTIPYALMLGGVDRFLIYALFNGTLLSATGFLLDTAVLLLISLASYRLTQARKMVNQYPWLYERSGPFAWRLKGHRREDGLQT